MPTPTEPVFNNRTTGQQLRVLSVHNQLSETNIPLEAFAYLAAIESQRFEMGVCSFYHGQTEARHRYASMYDPVHVELFGIDWHWTRPWRARSIWKLLRTWRPNVVHVHHTSSAAIVGTFTKRYTDAQLVTTVHRDFRTLPKVQQRMLQTAIRQSDAVVCNSAATLASVRPLCDANPVPITDVIYNGIDVTKLGQAAARTIDTNTLRVGAVGRLIPIKGFDTLIRSVASLLETGHRIELTLVGDGPQKNELVSLASQLGVGRAIRFTGGVTRPEVYRELQDMDVFVASSYSEGFCNGMVEAMAAGCPVVASDIDVFHELLGKEHPLYFSAGNPRQLADRLLHCLQAPAWRQQLGATLQTRARNHFSLAVSAKRHAELYQQLIHQCSSREGAQRDSLNRNRKAA